MNIPFLSKCRAAPIEAHCKGGRSTDLAGISLWKTIWKTASEHRRVSRPTFRDAQLEWIVPVAAGCAGAAISFDPLSDLCTPDMLCTTVGDHRHLCFVLCLHGFLFNLRLDRESQLSVLQPNCVLAKFSNTCVRVRAVLLVHRALR